MRAYPHIACATLEGAFGAKLMRTVTFDTLKLVDTLEKADIPRE